MTIAVFLADDHAVVRDGMRALLTAQPDIEVVGQADNGRDALRLIKELRPDVAVLDIAMPELNGIELARQVDAECPSTKTVMLSMHSTTEHIFRALQAGALAFVAKESAGREVVKAVRTAHYGHRYLSQSASDKIIDDYLRQRETGEPEDSVLADLTARECQVLQLVAEGKTTVEIAQALGLSAATIGTCRSRLMKKLGIPDIPTLVKFAIRHGLTPP